MELEKNLVKKFENWQDVADHVLAINQGACNSAGITSTLHGVLSFLLNNGKNTDYVNKHPFTRLILHQLVYLSGMREDTLMDYDEYNHYMLLVEIVKNAEPGWKEMLKGKENECLKRA